MTKDDFARLKEIVSGQEALNVVWGKGTIVDVLIEKGKIVCVLQSENPTKAVNEVPAHYIALGLNGWRLLEEEAAARAKSLVAGSITKKEPLSSVKRPRKRKTRI